MKSHSSSCDISWIYFISCKTYVYLIIKRETAQGRVLHSSCIMNDKSLFVMCYQLYFIGEYVRNGDVRREGEWKVLEMIRKGKLWDGSALSWGEMRWDWREEGRREDEERGFRGEVGGEEEEVREDRGKVNHYRRRKHFFFSSSLHYTFFCHCSILGLLFSSSSFSFSSYS